MKKLLLLGGSYFQLPSIVTAKKMGLYTVVCDYLADNPGQKYADEYWNVSTTDKEAILKLSKKLKIDGILCYASDPAASTAAYVSEKLGLPGQPYNSVEILTNKDLFRNFLLKNGFNVPKAKGYKTCEQLQNEWENFKKPIMVKPVDSSGSKGVSRVDNIGELQDKVNLSLTYSRCKRFIAEEYLEKEGYQIAGDGFSVKGKLVFRCFANEHFNTASGNPYVPIGESWPYIGSKNVQDKLHNEIQKLLNLLNMRDGAYNFDARIGTDGNIYLMEVGPRNGGNLIPQVTRYATGVDMVEYSIKAALGMKIDDLAMVDVKGYWSSYIIHSKRNGILDSLIISERLKKNNIVQFHMQYKKGDKINAFNGSNGTLGTMILRFSSSNEMLEKMNNMDSYIDVKVI